MAQKKSKSLEADIFHFLRTHTMCTLCTVDSDGAPRASPMEFWTNRPYIYLMSLKSKKLENMERDNRVSLAVYDQFEKDFTRLRGVQIFGTAEIIPHGTKKYEKQFEHSGYFGIDPKDPRYVNLVKITPKRMDMIDSKLPKDILKTKRIWRHRK
jgi:nitroimidazol reductase NimA-like FMN-containing flavoprotein (pyridoxamine 5'-phosphate oxidase superfamily)